jgi:hypothetical protein
MKKEQSINKKNLNNNDNAHLKKNETMRNFDYKKNQIALDKINKKIDAFYKNADNWIPTDARSNNIENSVKKEQNINHSDNKNKNNAQKNITRYSKSIIKRFLKDEKRNLVKYPKLLKKHLLRNKTLQSVFLNKGYTLYCSQPKYAKLAGLIRSRIVKRY